MLTGSAAFKKIETLEDISVLTPGVTILKYPIAGNPTSKIDVNVNNHTEYQISSVEAGYLVLSTPGYHANSAPLAKEFDRLIKDQKWWYQTF